MKQLPNALSIVRLILGLSFPLFPPNQRLLVVGLALFTEYLDGALARRFQWQSRLGEYLDPIADKVFVGMVAVTLVYEGSLAWWEAALLAGRDLIVVGAAIWYWTSRAPQAIGKMHPSFSGKLATTLQFAVLLTLAAGIHFDVLIAVTAVVSVYAGIEYIVRFKR